MKKTTGLKFMMIFMLVFSVSGCYTTGLSSKELGIYNYSNIVYGLYSEKEKIEKPAARVFDPQEPMKLGVAQVGEDVPHLAMLEALKKETGMFSQVLGLPLGGLQGNGNVYYAQNQNEIDVSGRIIQLCNMAEDMGLDYVLLYGGTAELASQPTAWSILDITIVGAYLVPSRKIQLDISSVGVLVDVKDRRPIILVNANQQARSRVAAIQSPEYYGSGQDVFLLDQKRIAVEKLAAQFVEKMKIYF
ncbi:MAG TPA: hypothetical protein P5160_00515 [Candidatus Omnitrophota bacterium]|nr:hypothetical protein [Candidatus Omnitrophota bacterium]